MPMPQDKFFDLTGAVFLKCVEVMRDKGADYAHDDNKLANFERQASSMGLPPLVILRVYLQKHIDAFDAYVKTGKVESEPLEMRIVDIVNYFVLALGQAIAVGYEPQEEWLRGALWTGTGTTPLAFPPPPKREHPNILQLRKQFAEQGLSIDPPPSGDEPPVTVAHVPKGKDGGDEAINACCNPDGDDCCDDDKGTD